LKRSFGLYLSLSELLTQRPRLGVELIYLILAKYLNKKLFIEGKQMNRCKIIYQIEDELVEEIERFSNKYIVVQSFPSIYVHFPRLTITN